LWWSTSTGSLAIRYNDGNSTQWVQVNSFPTVTGFLPLTGGTLSGNLTISKADPALILNKLVSGQANVIYGTQAGKARWTIVPGDGSAESSGNAGSNFYIQRYDDAGAYIDAPLVINRATADVTCAGRVIAGGSYFTGGGANVILSPTSTGTMWFRPLGPDNTSKQANYDSNGNFVIAANGWKPGGGAWADTSDERIKTVIGDYESGLDAVLSLNPVRYTFKGNDTAEDPEADKATVPPFAGSLHFDAATDGIEYIGLTAQNAEVQMPEMVKLRDGWIDGEQVNDMRSLDTTPLIFALVNAVKELTARIQALEAGNV
jgi:hypothetical protein